MLPNSGRSNGNTDGRSSMRTERSERDSMRIEMETSAHCSMLVWFATRAKQRTGIWAGHP